jgi:hypothetical protein
VLPLLLAEEARDGVEVVRALVEQRRRARVLVDRFVVEEEASDGRAVRVRYPASADNLDRREVDDAAAEEVRERRRLPLALNKSKLN